MQLKKVQFSELEIVYRIQKEGFLALYTKYKDEKISPYLESIEDIMEKFLTQRNSYYFIKDEQKIMGFVRIAFNRDYTRVKIGPIAILPEYQQQGYGKQAMLSLEKKFDQVKEWQVDTILQEKNLVHFYTSLGYKKLHKRETIKAGMDLGYFIKKIHPSASSITYNKHL